MIDLRFTSGETVLHLFRADIRFNLEQASLGCALSERAPDQTSVRFFLKA